MHIYVCMLCTYNICTYIHTHILCVSMCDLPGLEIDRESDGGGDSLLCFVLLLSFKNQSRNETLFQLS